MEIIQSKKVPQLLDSYPEEVKVRLRALRELIFETAASLSQVKKLIETTKWGEPSYLTKTGSTLRMDWKPRTPDKYYLFFTCSSDLIPTFKFIYQDELVFEGTRAIVLNLNEPLPKKSLTKCIELALTYHQVKHLPMLGI